MRFVKHIGIVNTLALSMTQRRELRAQTAHYSPLGSYSSVDLCHRDRVSHTLH